MAGPTGRAFWEGIGKRLRGAAGGKALLALGGGLALILLFLWMTGAWKGERVAPGTVQAPPAAPPPGRAVPVEKSEIEDFLEWPGTVRARVEARPASRLMARVREVKVRAGDPVKAGDPLAVLDDRDVRARVDQARAALAAAEAQAAQARAEHARLRALYDRQAATPRDLEAAEARAKSAAAQEAQARDALREAEVLLGEAVVRAPFDGVVAEKLVEPGDTAVPGRPLFVLHDPSRLRLEVQVPESCASRLSAGMDVRVRIDALGDDRSATVEEIAPVADPQSRTFLVKAALPAGLAIRPGTFGRLLQPCGKRRALLIPAAAVSRAGQIETVRVLEEGGAARHRHVKTGKAHGDRLEVLSGLREGETILLEEGRP